jgi:hypothetical protein
MRPASPGPAQAIWSFAVLRLEARHDACRLTPVAEFLDLFCIDPKILGNSRILLML